MWLWFTVLFANFAEAIAEGRGKAQAETLRRQTHGDAGKAPDRFRPEELQARRRADLKVGDVVLVEAGDSSPPTAR